MTMEFWVVIDLPDSGTDTMLARAIVTVES